MRPDLDTRRIHRHPSGVSSNTVALLDNNAKVSERVWYTPYGQARHHRGQDITGDRAFDTADVNALLTKIGGGSVPITDTAKYEVEYDLNRDGVISFADLPSGSAQAAVPLGQVSDLGATSGPDNWIGYAGYVWEGASSLYHVRFRSYSPELGRWMQRDPAGYVDGMGLYEYVGGWVSLMTDPFGLQAEEAPRWHHLIPQKIKDLLKQKGCEFDGTIINQPKYGWIFAYEDHPGYDMIHRDWNAKWYEYIESVAEGSAITEADLDKKLKELLCETDHPDFVEWLRNGAQADKSFSKWGGQSKEKKLAEFQRLRKAIGAKPGWIRRAGGKFLRFIKIGAPVFIVYDLVFTDKSATAAVVDNVVIDTELVGMGIECGQGAVRNFVQKNHDQLHRRTNDLLNELSGYDCDTECEDR